MKEFATVRVDSIIPDPEQPRKDFEPVALEELAASIKKQGLKTPISVRVHPNARAGERQFMIIAGERRWRAHQLAGLSEIDVLIESDGKAVSEEAIFAHQLIENIQREDLNPVERAEFLQRRVGWHKDQGNENALELVADELGKSVSWVSKSLQILKYAPDVRGLVRDGLLRDYALLKKLNKLPEKKRVEAVEMVKSGEFNGKEFFQRKRYDRSSKKAEGGKAVSQAKHSNQGGLPRLDWAQWTKIIARTDYKYLLSTQEGWENHQDEAVQNEIVSAFLGWVEAE